MSYAAINCAFIVNRGVGDSYIRKIGCQEVSAYMTTAVERHDWDADVARRTQTLGGGEITAILALAGATDVITFSVGVPDPATFPTSLLSEPAARLITTDPGGALQYSPTQRLASAPA